MSLPETIPFCPVHGEPWNDHEGACNQWLAAPDDSDCAVEWLRVAGRDDLVIRREADGSWPDWVLVGLGWTLDDSHDLPAVMDGVWRERPR